MILLSCLWPCILADQSESDVRLSAYHGVRDRIGVIQYTAAQRTQVAQSVKNLFAVIKINKIYVNRPAKIERYGSEYPDVDPVPKADKMLRNAAGMSDLEFHYGFLDLFTSIRDFHTIYQMPGPHKCVSLYKAVTFDIVRVKKKRVIVVSGFFSRIMSLSPDLHYITVGDELISISGLPIQKYLAIKNATVGGTNDSGTIRHFLASLSHIDGTFSRLPLETSEMYVFKSVGGDIYQIKLPWIKAVDNECWDQSNLRSIDIDNHSDSSTPKNQIGATPANKIKSYMTSSRHQDNQIRNSRFLFQTTVNPDLKWAIYDRKSTTIGIICLESFSSVSTNITLTLDLIRSILLTQLRHTSAIIFDVRSNLGGDIELADKIPQLFGPNIKTGSLRAILSPLNKELIERVNESDWVDAYIKSTDGDVYTDSVQFTAMKDANSIGQVYSKPVGVFTNGDCYSACEIFAANMKDNNISTIFGEDSQTGGGGANVVSYNSFLSLIDPTNFPSVPFLHERPLIAQDFHVSWRQFIRLDGSLIEDNGVTSDQIILPTIADLSSSKDRSSSTQYDRISDILIRNGQDSGRNATELRVYPESDKHIRTGESFVIRIFSTGFSCIAIYNSKGHLLSSKIADPAIEFRALINASTTGISGEYNKYKICGFDTNGKLLFSTWRTVWYDKHF